MPSITIRLPTFDQVSVWVNVAEPESKVSVQHVMPPSALLARLLSSSYSTLKGSTLLMISLLPSWADCCRCLPCWCLDRIGSSPPSPLHPVYLDRTQDKVLP
ncbi:101aa long hypothetical protein [Pyrococcus horikoshii OT3]|uniref:Uncharacterized protein n=1 Tax=Pyrococcus horikoshii (strain ATCC 700860 / DSM 12428 / JCM 9974 / NBRC 100139 / OT-3) TaxID=70601 RepID=O58575_PYRHO|nr:101aa long hypothetical protein [Pyrococcus horikoshii OT3]